MIQVLPTWLEDLLRVLSYGNEILAGLGRTLSLYFTALVMGFFLGLVFAIGRQYGGMLVSRICTAYIEIIRGTPLLVQLFLFYFFPYSLSATLELFGFPPLPLDWGIQVIGPGGSMITILNHRIFTCYLMLGLNSTAYQAEYLRGAIASVSAGQLLAAQSLGLSRLGGIRSVVLPQSLRRVIPSWSNEAAYLPKYTVVAYFIGVEDLFAVAHYIVARTFLTLTTYLVIALIYLVLITIISRILDYVHDKTKIPGL
ncbi:MAG: amino acid ABC transporter permease [Candidatus Thorarchaeota archaeon]